MPLTLNALELRNATMRADALGDMLGRRYTQQIVAQLYKVIGAIDVIGNPVSLFSNLSTGVEDFFYEPALGIVESPAALAIGLGRGTTGSKTVCVPPSADGGEAVALARAAMAGLMPRIRDCALLDGAGGGGRRRRSGTVSLLRNSVFGVFDGVSRITSSVGKGLAEATLDDDFIERRREDQRRAPSNMLMGVANGALTIAKGVGSGLAGVVMKPVEGAREGGALGFFKGVGVGAIGVVTKPVVSVFDGATQGASPKAEAP